MKIIAVVLERRRAGVRQLPPDWALRHRIDISAVSSESLNNPRGSRELFTEDTHAPRPRGANHAALAHGAGTGRR